MKKIIVVLSALVLVTGCAVKPPKVGDIVKNDAPLELTSNPSNALIDMATLGAVGVRDLTKKEFNLNKKDIERLEKFTGPRSGFNRGAYEAGGIGLGLAAGFSFGSVLGYGAVTSFFSDDRPDNYGFAWDFDGRFKLYSSTGVDVDKLNSALSSSVNAAADEYAELFPLGGSVKEEVKPAGSVRIDVLGREVKENHFSYAYLSNKKNKSAMVEFLIAGSHKCVSGDKECIVYFIFNKGYELLPMQTVVARLVALELNEGSFIYLPPNKAIYRLPMIIRGGTGEIEYLVEK